jgi:hypothetical protein
MRQSTSLLLLLILLLSLLPFGLFLAGYSVPPDLTLVPIATEPGASSISWLVWGTLAVLIAATLTPPIWRFFTFSITTKPPIRFVFQHGLLSLLQKKPESRLFKPAVQQAKGHAGVPSAALWRGPLLLSVISDKIPSNPRTIALLSLTNSTS